MMNRAAFVEKLTEIQRTVEGLLAQLQALIVAGAAGPEPDANNVIKRFGFGKCANVQNLTSLLRMLRDE